MKLLVTGGAGFIGSNFVHYWLEKYPDDLVVNLDKLTYAGNVANLQEVEDNKQYVFVQGDIGDRDLVERICRQHEIDTVVNFAAESHNSRAILNPSIFYETNVVGTERLMEGALASGVKRFHHVSTCEVFGDLALDSDEVFTEESPYEPKTPYNASKAASDMAVRVFGKTFGLPITISNTANNYGRFQFPEKIIPYFVTLLMQDKPMTLYKTSSNRREWIHVDDHCSGIDLILQKGKPGETYNIGTGVEKDIETIANLLLDIFELDESYKQYIPDRPSHDRRYLLDSSKIRDELGWKPEHGFEQGFRETVQWYRDNEVWWKPLLERVIDESKAWDKK